MVQHPHPRMKGIPGIAVFWLAWAISAGCGSNPGPNPSPPELNRDVVFRTAAVDRLSPDWAGGLIHQAPVEGSGSGVLLDPSRILTAAHVVEGDRTIRVRVPIISRGEPVGMNFLKARVVSISKSADLALLEIPPNRELPQAPLAADPLQENEFVFVFDASPVPHDVSLGRALGPTQINCSGQPGSSGSGVWVLRNGWFELAGMVSSALIQAPVVTNVWSGQFGTERVQVHLVRPGPILANLIPAERIRGFLEGAKEVK